MEGTIPMCKFRFEYSWFESYSKLFLGENTNFPPITSCDGSNKHHSRLRFREASLAASTVRIPTWAPGSGADSQPIPDSKFEGQINLHAPESIVVLQQ